MGLKGGEIRHIANATNVLDTAVSRGVSQQVSIDARDQGRPPVRP